MFNPDTGPRLQTPEERARITQTFQYPPSMEGQFDQFGVFTLTYLSYTHGESYDVRKIKAGLPKSVRPVAIPYWSPRLFQIENPDAYKLRFDPERDPRLELVNNSSGEASGIRVQDIREIDETGMSGRYKVGLSGYALRFDPDPQSEYFFEERDLRLLQAEKGETQRGSDEGTYIKITEPGWEGKEVLLLDLFRQGNTILSHSNVIVLSSEQKRLLFRELRRPFA